MTPDMTLTEAVRELVEVGDERAVPAAMMVENALAAGAQLVQPGDLLGPADVADVVGVNRTTVSRWNRDGYLPPALQVVGGVPIWTRAAIEAFRDEHRERSDAVGRRPLGSAAR